MRKGKKVIATSIIGGADGPTSVFLAGKLSDGKKKRLSYRQRKDLNKGNRRLSKLKNKLKRTGIVSHTLEELEEYICTKYGAVAISQDSVEYQRALKSLKSNLVFRFFEDMIPMEHPVFPKGDPTPEKLKEYNDKIQKWFKAAEEVEIPEEEICFHYYKIELKGKDKGEVILELELRHQALFVSTCYSSNNKSLYKKADKVMKDIYYYYGVTDEDMDKGSERFLVLAAVLQSGKEKWGRKKKRRAGCIWHLGFFFLILRLLKWIFKRISLFENA